MSLWQPFDVPRVICAHIARSKWFTQRFSNCYFYSECTRLAQVLRTGVPDQVSFIIESLWYKPDIHLCPRVLWASITLGKVSLGLRPRLIFPRVIDAHNTLAQGRYPIHIKYLCLWRHCDTYRKGITGLYASYLSGKYHSASKRPETAVHLKAINLNSGPLKNDN